ncbi:uncharacterized protein LOC112461639 [Temnothorax curvispinosus]|uniref:Uncharacterized protein LOC112461639 n=1 Tax=Temnothorax curvispinosus TaxID=300111 RepID=A0A6J1QQA8_9HYME|nr:uncharacterized protein LOC112461639 [Temnothorax curvispinosus]
MLCAWYPKSCLYVRLSGLSVYHIPTPLLRYFPHFFHASNLLLLLSVAVHCFRRNWIYAVLERILIILSREDPGRRVWRKKSNNGIFSASVEEISDSDSQFSFSNEESSSMHDTNEAEAENTDKEGDFNLKVIASRGDNIIAVANPALMECSHPIKEEPADEKPTL